MNLAERFAETKRITRMKLVKLKEQPEPLIVLLEIRIAPPLHRMKALYRMRHPSVPINQLVMMTRSIRGPNLSNLCILRSQRPLLSLALTLQVTMETITAGDISKVMAEAVITVLCSRRRSLLTFPSTPPQVRKQ